MYSVLSLGCSRMRAFARACKLRSTFLALVVVESPLTLTVVLVSTGAFLKIWMFADASRHPLDSVGCRHEVLKKSSHVSATYLYTKKLTICRMCTGGWADQTVCRYGIMYRYTFCMECVDQNISYISDQCCFRVATIGGGGRGCNKFVPVLRGDGTIIVPRGDLFDQPPGEMNWIRGKLAGHAGDHVVLSPEEVIFVPSPGTESSYPRPPNPSRGFHLAQTFRGGVSTYIARNGHIG